MDIGEFIINSFIVQLWFWSSVTLSIEFYTIFCINNRSVLSIRSFIQRLSRISIPIISYIFSPISCLVLLPVVIKRIKKIIIRYYKENYSL